MTISALCIYTVESYVSVEKPISDGISIPFGIAMIASALKHQGHHVQVIVFTSDTPLQETLRPFLAKFSPRLVCMTSVATQFPLVSRIAQAVKELDHTIFVALGGPHASLQPEIAIDCPYIDAICVGEGDTAVVELATQLGEGRQPKGIHNFWFKSESGFIEKNPSAPFIKDLDQLPFIDRDMWRPWINRPEKDPAVLVGRGCPFRCSYCSNHSLRKLAPGPYVRFRSPANVIKEIEQISREQAVTNVYLEVETIGANLEYALALCQALADFNSQRNTPINFKINLAVTSILIRDIILLNQLFSAFKSANIITINIGLESGSEAIRSNVLNRARYSNKDIVNFCDIAKKYNMKINLYVMIGIPGETLTDFKQTIQVVKLCQPNWVYLSIFYPYPGTDLYKVAKEKGLFSEQTLSEKVERRHAYLALPEFPKSRIMWEYILFNFHVYKGRWSLIKRLLYTTRVLLLTNEQLENLYLYLSRKTKLGRSLYHRYGMDF
jgi:radical SAM superfamily enzyme YgiQ (UPF0313 family)